MEKTDYLGSIRKFSIKHPATILFFICFFLCFLGFYAFERIALAFGLFGFALLGIITLVLKKRGKLNQTNIIILLFCCGFLLRLCYVLYTGCMERQHDVEAFGSGHGHAGYIEYLLNNLKLPDFDVRSRWQFYHPPFHHIVCAIYLKIITSLGVEYASACESIQMLTLFYSSLCMIISYRIMRELELKGKALNFAFSIIAFHPTFIIFSGSINNDILSITFQIAAMLYAIRWYKNQTFRGIVKVALCIGLGMMTKLSVWMVAPAVACLFVYAVFESKRKRSLSFYVGQYSLFGAVCVPLGLWWGIRNLKMFGVPLTYIPKLDESNGQFVGFHSVFKRLFDFNFSQFESVFDKWGDPYFEYNPTIGLLKTAMFGESLNDTHYPQIGFFGTVLFWIGTLLSILALVSMVISFKRRYTIKPIFKFFLLCVGLVTIVMYYYFCITYDFTCTQNIRYATPLILIGSLFIGFMLQYHEVQGTKYTKFITRFTSLIISAFCIFSSITYLLIGI